MRILKRSVIILSFAVASIGLFAQTVEEAGAKYNEGVEQMKAKDYSNAVTTLEQALKLANGAGADADDLKGNIQKQLENAYYRNGISKYKAKKYDASIAEFEKSYAIATELGNTEMQNKLTVIMAKVLSGKGMSLIKKGDLDGAYAVFDEAHEVKSTCVISYYGKGLVWKERGDMGQMMTNMDKAIEIGATEPKMAKYVARAKKAASRGLIAEATEEITKEHGKVAAEYINDSFKYAAGTADTYYYLTIAYNKSSQFSKAVDVANKSIGMKEGDKSDVYFELGQALEGKGDAAGACNAYKKVSSGPNVDAAKYQIKEKLKCS